MSKVQKLVNIALAEFLGTASMLFLVCTGCTSGIQGTISSLHLSLCSGLSVMAAIQMFGHISGAHINPVVSLAALMVDEISYLEIPVYIVSQVLGCLAGCGLQKALGVEIILTTILVLAVLATWDKRNGNNMDSVALRIGFLVGVLNLAAGSYTGASMNPVRSFGPAVWSNDFRSHWVYWVGPTIGSLIATITYKYSFLRVEVHTREYK
ncbi:unnamed protein product [Acanthoscelides obtectus]|uniref:Uncharacterized protein n=1 Tax=Acanthoscelides obtectus TaxID=200917 RepID=A0A9P0JME1_ACAOB|nr:unnamed protein product [Acanthoscelides obtectus]CAK1634611.1 Aquaporin-2 [Acanthoscelides obtectus]